MKRYNENIELHTIRGGTREELEAHKYNIGIGISLGNKWFSPENIIEAIKWAFPYTREYVIVYVADTIHAINLGVRNKVSDESALRTAVRHGREILERVRELAQANFDANEQAKIIYATWPDVATDDHVKKVNYLYVLYGSNERFRNCIEDVVRIWISKEERKFNEDEIHKFGTYILEELPELMARVRMKGIVCDAYAYPHDGVITQLVEKLQTGDLFPEIRERILDTEPKVFLEVR